MLDGQIALLTLAAARYFALGEVPPRLGTEHPGRVPSASFVCADGGYLHITASDQHWPPLCKALGLEAWGSDPELQSNSGRLRRRDEVTAKLTAAFVARNRDDVAAALDAAGVPQGPIRTVDEILTDEHVARPRAGPDLRASARRRLPGAARAVQARRLRRSSSAAPAARSASIPKRVLAERLGLSRERIAQLREAKAI